MLISSDVFKWDKSLQQKSGRYDHLSDQKESRWQQTNGKNIHENIYILFLCCYFFGIHLLIHLDIFLSYRVEFVLVLLCIRLLCISLWS